MLYGFDKSRFPLSNDTRSRLHLRSNKELYLDCVKGQFQTGDDVLMIWGCFSYEWDSLTEVTTNVNQHICCNILKDQVLHFSQHLHDEYIVDIRNFHDDNNKVYRARRKCD